MNAHEFLTKLKYHVEQGDDVYGFLSIRPFTWIFSSDETPPVASSMKVKLLPFEGFQDDAPYLVASSLSDLKGAGDQPLIRWILVENFMEASMLATPDYRNAFFPVEVISRTAFGEEL
jgi:hypothetical protein